MTLGNLIKILEKEDINKTIDFGFYNPDSYRGIYACVSFEPTGNMKVGEILEHAKDALIEDGRAESIEWTGLQMFISLIMANVVSN